MNKYSCNKLKDLYIELFDEVHYSGNFWWSKSSHIKNLPNMSNWLPDGNYLRWRVMAEMWLCQIPDGKYSCAWQSNINHYQQNYPKELYESN
jgi:hypothetical protein